MLSDRDNQASRLSGTDKAVDVCMRSESQEKQCSTEFMHIFHKQELINIEPKE